MTVAPKLQLLDSPDYIQWVRQQPCLARNSSKACWGDVVPHHILMGWMTKGKQPPDDRCVPLCVGHHRQLHDHGEKTFWTWLFNEDRLALQEVALGFAKFNYWQWVDFDA